jgi:hypothetical protein
MSFYYKGDVRTLERNFVLTLSLQQVSGANLKAVYLRTLHELRVHQVQH